MQQGPREHTDDRHDERHGANAETQFHAHPSLRCVGRGAAGSGGEDLPLEKLRKIFAHLIGNRIHDGLSLPDNLADVGKQQMRRRHRGKDDDLPAPDPPDGDLQMVAGQPGEGIPGGSLLDMGLADDRLAKKG